MNVVRDERGLISGLEDDDGLVREVVRDEQGRLTGIRDLRPVEATLAKATAGIERVIRQEVRAAVAELLEQLAKATTPPPARPPASTARYHELMSTAKRGMRLNGGPRHAAVMSALAAMQSGDVDRACRILEGVG